MNKPTGKTFSDAPADSTGSESKNRILKAAEKLFADKGFDGARVDEIARQAKVNKALIYYYFKSKEAILEELMELMVSEAMEAVDTMVPPDFSLESLASPEERDKIMQPLFAFLRERADLMKIVLMESLKSSSHNETVFRLISAMVERQEEFFKRFNMPAPNKQSKAHQIVGEFFTGMLPLAGYFALEERWSRFLDISRDHLWEIFQQSFISSHLAYTLDGIQRS
ncbi:helix-turn-helix domain-containing protein [Marispirochaeta sp.]|uniref:TetR/AcrR family transcriptional regulator n=1 Tax=Marispirochaeta sp. TaxID=2038653 RepID=UPI0029C6762F|nr:helix-turn-helix domain-containing protein [Marispirochaeta sp.]